MTTATKKLLSNILTIYFLCVIIVLCVLIIVLLPVTLPACFVRSLIKRFSDKHTPDEDEWDEISWVGQIGETLDFFDPVFFPAELLIDLHKPLALFYEKLTD